MKLTRENAILPFTPASDLSNMEGNAVSINSAGEITLHASGDTKPFGVIIHGTTTEEKTSVALLSGGLRGTVKLKLKAAVNQIGQVLHVAEDGSFSPDGSAYPIACAQALETGVEGELVEAVLFHPLKIVDAMIVEGAGTAGVNGTYLRDGDSGGKPRYTLVGGTTGDDSIQWVGSKWSIISGGGLEKYESSEDVATPDLVVTWAVLGGTAPVPTVRRGSLPDSGLIV